MNYLLGTGGGFLLAVLWMDLMFDVLVFRGAVRQRESALAEDVLAQIAAYYRRVTTTAAPMNHLVSVVMAGMVTLLVFELFRGERRAVSVASLALCAVPIALALLRIFPNAIRLGSRTDDVFEQSRLARGICTAHLFCFAAIAAFVTLRFAAANT
jgi:hypothetical protein